MSSVGGLPAPGRHHTDGDLELARKLQRELNQNPDTDDNVFVQPPTIVRRRPNGAGAKRSHNLSCSAAEAAGEDDPLNATQNLVHPDWETRDPTPDIQSLFRAFDAKFFQRKLQCVSLEWSRRMYQCAGICYYRRNQQGTSITIRLSEPLLKLRQRKDLVETLLHEMIHAYLFVLNIRESNGGHGPNFKRIMVSINQTTGTNITVYHTFHDEVNVYKNHVWKCNGICQHRKPFFGVVKRTCNRAPGPNDMWWAGHQQSCGGYFKKISEPEKKPAAGKGATKKAGKEPAAKKVRFEGTIRGLDDANNVRQRITDPKWGMAVPPPPAAAKAASTTSTVKTVPPRMTVAPVPTRSGGNLSNVHGFRDLTSDGDDEDSNGVTSTSGNGRTAAGGNLRNVVGFRDLTEGGGQPNRNVNTMEMPSGSGHTLGGGGGASGSGAAVQPNEQQPQYAVVDLVRNVWDKKFGNTAVPAPKKDYTAIPSTSRWQSVDGDDDDDVLINDHQIEIIQLNSDSEDDDADDADMFRDRNVDRKPDISQLNRPVLTQDQRQRAIKSEILDDQNLDPDDIGPDHRYNDANDNDPDDSDIILIDDEFDDTLVEAADAAVNGANGGAGGAGAHLDTSVIDDLFGTDSLLADYANINDAMPTSSDAEQIVTCPICSERMSRGSLQEHLNGCLGIRQHLAMPIDRRSPAGPSRQPTVPRWKPPVVAASAAMKRERPSSTNRRSRSESQVAAPAAAAAAVPPAPAVPVEPELTPCPSCWRQVPMADINAHLDECLS